MHEEHGDHHTGDDHSGYAEMFKQRFFVALLLDIPVLFLSPMMGITIAYFYSIYAFVMNHIVGTEQMMHDFFWELASLILIMLLGHWIEMKAVGNAGNALEKLSELLPNTALRILSAGDVEEVSLQDVKAGDLLQVRAGDQIPADGTIRKGSTSVNESMITGESREVEKKEGDALIGRSINGSGTIEMEVTGTGESGYFAKVMVLTRSAREDQSRAETLADRVANWLFYIALAIGIIAFIAWFVTGHSFDVSLLRLVTVLIIACPHALGLAIPLVVARSTAIGAKNGLLIRGCKANEAA